MRFRRVNVVAYILDCGENKLLILEGASFHGLSNQETSPRKGWTEKRNQFSFSRLLMETKSMFPFESLVDQEGDRLEMLQESYPHDWQAGGSNWRKEKRTKGHVEVGGTCVATGWWKLTRTLGRRGWGETQSYRVMGGESQLEVTHFKVSSYLLNISCHAMICSRYGEHKSWSYFVFFLVEKTSIKYGHKERWFKIQFVCLHKL